MESTVPTPTPSPTPTRTPVVIQWVDFPTSTGAAAKSDRGNLVKKAGEPAGVRDNTGEDLMLFMVRAITANPECEGGEDAPTPQNGYFVRVDVQGQASPGLEQASQQASIAPALSFSDWGAIDANGVKVNADVITEAAIACLSDPEMIYYTEIRSGERGVGSVVVDVPTQHGTLIFRLGEIGWEYTY